MSTTVELYYHESDARDGAEEQTTSQQDATPLVILHGLFGSADNWRSHIKSWSRTRRVIAVDLRNHGRSPHVAGMSYPEQAADVIALLDRLARPCLARPCLTRQCLTRQCLTRPCLTQP